MGKNVLSINLGNYGSTGMIMCEISKKAEMVGYIAYQAFPVSARNKPLQERDIIICSKFSKKINEHLGIWTGFYGCFSYFSTKSFLEKVKKINPDIIHLHNIHGGYINLSLLFKYIKKNNIRVIWTLHDCWAFTGHCSHFDMIGCDKWKTGCYKCTQLNEYPTSRVDRTKTMYNLKKKWFTGVKDLTIVTPSKWLADLVKQSFLKDYSVKVINNGINLEIFKPTDSDFRKKYNCVDKFILLGVAFDWGERKGLDVFIELSKRLDNKFQIVLVGTDDVVDKQLPENIISIHRTHNQQELAEIYTAADLFVNPTREETYPTVNMESLACGTPVVTFNTGGSPEIFDESCGLVTESNDVDTMKRAIIHVCENKPFSPEACLERAKSFDKSDRYDEYIELNKSIIKEILL